MNREGRIWNGKIPGGRRSMNKWNSNLGCSGLLMKRNNSNSEVCWESMSLVFGFLLKVEDVFNVEFSAESRKLPSFWVLYWNPKMPLILSSLLKWKPIQFSSRWYLCARKSPYALHPVSQKFPHRCLWNGSAVRLIDDGPLSSFQGRSSSASSLYACLLHAMTTRTSQESQRCP